MPAVDHTDSDLEIFDMVVNRLPFLVDDAATRDTLSNFTLELMHELEGCLQIASRDYITPGTGYDEVDPADPDRVGHEEHYTVSMQSLFADLVALYVLMFTAAANSSSGETIEASNKFLSKAKAGSVEVEYDQFAIGVSSGLFTTNTKDLKDYLMTTALRKARKLGCQVDICMDCVSLEDQKKYSRPVPFITSVCDVGC